MKGCLQEVLCLDLEKLCLSSASLTRGIHVHLQSAWLLKKQPSEKLLLLAAISQRAQT